MVIKIAVSNYALISKLELDLEAGFSVVTGETGAGKSIILGAIRLAIGERADTKVLFDQTRKCVVELTFAMKGYGLEGLFKKLDLDFWPETIIRREILPSGKSRAFVNDTPVKLSDLKEITVHLIDIHSQNESLSFRTKAFQFDLLDAYAGILLPRETYLKQYKQYKDIETKINELKAKETQSKLDEDYFSFLLNELKETELKPGETAEIEQELSLLQKGEEIQRLLAVGEELFSGQNGVLGILDNYKKELNNLSGLGEPYIQWIKQLQSAKLELEDLAESMGQHTGGGDFDEERLLNLHTRLNTLNALMQKHRVLSEDELISVMETLEEKMRNISHLTEDIEALEQQLNLLEQNLTKAAKELHQKRLKAAKSLKEEVDLELNHLAMKEAQINFRLTPTEAFDAYGHSNLEIYFKTNLGAPEELLYKVASGGELSRLMLTLKAILSEKKQLPSIIFDEIDTGVSGEIAGRMGGIMAKMGEKMQVLSITHLPQVAGQGKHHFTVYKHVESNRTVSKIKPLNTEDRIMEVAKMLSGEQVEAAAIATAKSLIK